MRAVRAALCLTSLLGRPSAAQADFDPDNQTTASLTSAAVREQLQAVFGASSPQALAGSGTNDVAALLDAVVAASQTTEAIVVDPTQVWVKGDVIEENDTLHQWFMEQQWRTFVSDVGRVGRRKVKDLHITYVTIRGNGTKGVLTIVPGRGETIMSYDEVARDFMLMGYSPIYLMSHRGQGESDLVRNVSEGPHYVENNEDMIMDFRSFVRLVLQEVDADPADAAKPNYLLCHSMGCAVSLAFLLEQERFSPKKEVFNAVVAVAPMIKIRTGSIPYDVAVSLVKVMTGMGLGSKFAPLQGTTFEDYWSVDNKNYSTISFSHERAVRKESFCFQYRHQAVAHDNHHGICPVATSNRVMAVLSDYYTRYFDKDSNKMWPAIRTPILLQAPEFDTIVNNNASEAWCATQPNCTMAYILRSKHAVHFETDSVREDWLSDSDQFFGTYNASSTVGFTFVLSGAYDAKSTSFFLCFFALLAACVGGSQS